MPRDSIFTASPQVKIMSMIDPDAAATAPAIWVNELIGS
jgi:hypothetical protein